MPDADKHTFSLVKPDNYYSYARRDLLRLFPSHKVLHVLEIGCGTGETGELLKKEFGVKYITGVDIESSVIEAAGQRLDRVIQADIEKAELDVEEGSVDFVLLADVIEHLTDPWRAIQKLERYLKPNGLMLISVPNLQHWRNILNLILGRWDYTSSGMMDITHLRFFTKRTIQKLLVEAGFKLLKIQGNSGKICNFLNRATFGLFSGFFSFRYFILAVRNES